LQAIAFSYNEEFAKTIEDRMQFYNTDKADCSIDNIGAVKNQIEKVKGVMVQNIEKVLERGENIELLVYKTDRLNQQAFCFESSSRNLRWAMYWKQVRCNVGIGEAVTFLVFIASASMCGGLSFHHCRKH
jgi:vesicle-associated membrane protein 7